MDYLGYPSNSGASKTATDPASNTGESATETASLDNVPATDPASNKEEPVTKNGSSATKPQTSGAEEQLIERVKDLKGQVEDYREDIERYQEREDEYELRIKEERDMALKALKAAAKANQVIRMLVSGKPSGDTERPSDIPFTETELKDDDEDDEELRAT